MSGTSSVGARTGDMEPFEFDSTAMDPPDDDNPRRRRLLKACTPCHRAKRRCEGTNPCSNCVFAKKRCYYSDASGREVPPPSPDVQHGAAYPGTRSLDPEKAYQPRRGNAAFRSGATSIREPSTATSNSAEEDYSSQGLGSVADTDDQSYGQTTANLLNIFFTYCHPTNFMFHRPTFLHDAAYRRTPPYLLNAVLAVAAGFPLPVQQTLSPQSPMGRSDLAERQAQVKHYVDNTLRDLFDDDGNFVPKRPQEEAVELVQALYCLHHARSSNIANNPAYKGFLSHMTDILADVGVQDWDRTSDSTAQSSQGNFLRESQVGDVGSVAETRTTWQRRECLRRALWVVHLDRCMAHSFSSVPMPYREADVTVDAPVSDAAFEMLLVEVAAASPPGPLRSIQSLPDASTRVADWAYLLKCLGLHCEIMEALVSYDPSRHTSEHPHVWRTEALSRLDSLEAKMLDWERSLPDAMQLSESNLQHHLTVNSIGSTHAPFVYITMHCFSRLSLIAINSVDSLFQNPQVLATRVRDRELYFDQVIYLMKTGDRRAQCNLHFAPILHLIGAYQALAKDPSSASYAHASFVLEFFNDYEADWGIRISDFASLNFRRSWSSVYYDIPLPVSAQGNTSH